MASQLHGRTVLPQPLLSPIEIGQHLVHLVPESVAVVQVAHVAKLANHGGPSCTSSERRGFRLAGRMPSAFQVHARQSCRLGGLEPVPKSVIIRKISTRCSIAPKYVAAKVRSSRGSRALGQAMPNRRVRDRGTHRHRRGLHPHSGSRHGHSRGNPGRHLETSATPMCNPYLNIPGQMGVPTLDRFRDSTGRLASI